MFLKKKRKERKKKTTHTANPSDGASRTAPTVRLSKAAQARSGSQGAPQIRLRLLYKRLYAPLSSGRGVAEKERAPGPSPFWCLGVLASVPSHQVPEGTTKSTPATAKRGPKGWGPSTAVASEAAPRQEEARGTKGALRKP